MPREKSLILHCIPFIKRGVGSAWGLPVVATGKERRSALSLSEKLQAPGIVSFGADPFRTEHLYEMEALGIGPLGRYLGGEPIKPVRLNPEDFFCSSIGRSQTGERTEKTSTAELFCTGLEFGETYWITDGQTSDLFTSHLEFLRTWGFSGGLIINETALAQLLAGYIICLQKETNREKAKVIVLASRNFYETQLGVQLPMAKVSADPAAGEIPVNFAAGNVPVLSQEMSGLGIVLYEDLGPVFRTQKARCDILIAVNPGTLKNQRTNSVYTEEIATRLKLTVSAEGKTKHTTDLKKEISLKTYLFRNCCNGALPFPLNRKTDCRRIADHQPAYSAEIRRKGTSAPDLKQIHLNSALHAKNQISREEAAALDLLPQWTAGRIATAGGCLFAVNTKFSGLRAADFKEEQSLFYHDMPGTKQNWDSPPIRNNASFNGLNQTQLEFFLRWRSECRRGYIRIMPDSMYIETYILLYSEELVLCMGKEGPLQHFTALLHLFHACTEHYPETSVRLCKHCVEFAVIHEIAAEAFPILLNELVNNGWFNETHSEIADTENLLIDLALWYFFIEAENNFEKQEYWSLIKKLIPPGLLARKYNDKDLPVQFCHTLGILDTQLRRDWNRSFFMLFFPPLLQRYNCNAFETGRAMGDSSYTVLRPGFSVHKPLLDILAALTLTPDRNPLPGVKARLHPLSLENELLEELRKESDEVREMLTPEDYSLNEQSSASSGRNHAGSCRQKRIEHHPETLDKSTLSESAYIPVNKTTLAKFIASLEAIDQKALESIIQTAHDPASTTTGVSDTTIDKINAAFYKHFGDLLIETGRKGPSISDEYAVILEKWE